MGIVNYLLRDPFNNPWPESELNKKFVVATINSFHEALYCMSSRLESIGSLEGMLQNSHRLMIAMTTKTVKNEQSSTGTRENNLHDCQNS